MGLSPKLEETCIRELAKMGRAMAQYFGQPQGHRVDVERVSV